MSIQSYFIDLKDKNVAVLGLGVEGIDLVTFLLGKGAKVTVLDKKEKDQLEFSSIPEAKVDLKCGENYLENLQDFEIVFRSPGVYRFLPEIVAAEKKGVVISSAIKLFFDECKAKIIGVTGTKGKGTTSTLIYQILKNAGCDVYLAGNIGTSYLDLLPKLKRYSIVVLEMSSFQLIDLQKSPHIAVVLNITSDHMDWHKNVAEYIEAKQNLVKFQKKSDFAVINDDYDVPRSFSQKTKAKIVYFSRIKHLESGAFVENDEIVYNNGKELVSYGKRFGLTLRGDHNLENVCAAVVATKVMDVKDDVIKGTIFSFKGLEHRLEFVKNVGGVNFYNDSFATGPQPTIAAIKSFSEPTTVILGGSDKNLEYDELGVTISKSKNVKCVILIGQIGEKIADSIKRTSYKGKLINLGKVDISKIVHEAFKNTPKGGVVLMSPAAASFDMFKDYKDRGKKFKEAVNSLV